jgi:probable phosphoglycerate mutase
MLHLILIRPGATDFDLAGRIQGTLDIPLCQQGVEETNRIGTELKTESVSVIYSSPCQSAHETAQRLAKQLGVKVKLVEELSNLNQGLWQGMLVEEVRAKQPTVFRQWQDQPEIICPPGGETLADALQRLEPALRKILKKHSTGTVALVVPEPLASVLESFLTHQACGDLWKADLRTGGWKVIKMNGGPLVYRGCDVEEPIFRGANGSHLE